MSGMNRTLGLQAPGPLASSKRASLSGGPISEAAHREETNAGVHANLSLHSHVKFIYTVRRRLLAVGTKVPEA